MIETEEDTFSYAYVQGFNAAIQKMVALMDNERTDTSVTDEILDEAYALYCSIFHKGDK